MRGKNPNKIAFIICSNNKQLYLECEKYLLSLDNPQNREIEIIKIENAKSMASGYNQGMNKSDAKYKVYLHQDVFIINKHFIEDVIRLFEENPEYGMLGVLGCNYMVKDANYWNHWNVGCVYAWNSLKLIDVQMKKNKYIENVNAIDGLLMMTQYDFSWREDFLDGYDMYDVSQSIEVQNHGYKVGVPYQNTTWCLHDCGSSNMENYDIYRKRLCEEYQSLGYHFEVSIENERERLMNQEIKKLMLIIWEHILKGELSEAAYIINSLMEMKVSNTQVGMAYIACRILLMEKKTECNSSIFINCKTGEEICETLLGYILKLQRNKFGKFEEPEDDFDVSLCKQEIISIIAEHAIIEEYC